MLWANNIFIKMEKIKFQDSFPKWLQLSYPYQWCGRVPVDPHFLHTGFDQSFNSSCLQANGDKLVPCGVVLFSHYIMSNSFFTQVSCLAVRFLTTAPPGKPVLWCICIIFFIKHLLSLCLKSHIDFITFCSKITFFMYEWCIKSCTYLMYERHEFWGEYICVKPSCQSM